MASAVNLGLATRRLAHLGLVSTMPARPQGNRPQEVTCPARCGIGDVGGPPSLARRPAHGALHPPRTRLEDNPDGRFGDRSQHPTRPEHPVGRRSVGHRRTARGGDVRCMRCSGPQAGRICRLASSRFRSPTCARRLGRSAGRRLCRRARSAGRRLEHRPARLLRRWRFDGGVAAAVGIERRSPGHGPGTAGASCGSSSVTGRRLSPGTGCGSDELTRRRSS